MNIRGACRRAELLAAHGIDLADYVDPRVTLEVSRFAIQKFRRSTDDWYFPAIRWNNAPSASGQGIFPASA